MKQYDRLIFVDSDDTTRAPMAKAIMKSKFLMGSLEILSRGLVVLFPEPMNQKAEAVLISNGYNTKDHAATQLMQEDINDRALILTMEDSQKAKIWGNYENAANVYTITEFIRLSGDVTPLYGEPLAAYGQCYEILEALVSGIVIQLNEEELRK
ncbi:MAG TPA: phosphotyrosine protein phosphatase [Candidatus Pelethocola excrementipullorum]|nr:phosphotyrosine protein phosphatase [Candidatus Pelethocola excrementipullorum]